MGKKLTLGVVTVKPAVLQIGSQGMKCKNCGKRIREVVTDKGSKIIVDGEGRETYIWKIDLATRKYSNVLGYQSHTRTCKAKRRRTTSE